MEHRLTELETHLGDEDTGMQRLPGSYIAFAEVPERDDGDDRDERGRTWGGQRRRGGTR